MTIEIVLATCNGARYLQAQLDSLLAQDERGWLLLMQDDGSTDGTRDMLAAFAQAHPGRARLLPPAPRKLGAAGNFASLLAATRAPYVMCCDQDDVWMPDKIARSMALMRKLEAEHGAQTPLLLHTDAIVTDAELTSISGSRMAQQKLKPEEVTLARLLVQNVAQGATLLMNRALLDLALPLPPGVRMYDMWLALAAMAAGRMGYLPEPTLHYRQHAANVIGTGRRARLAGVAQVQNLMEANIAQAALLQERLGGRVAPPEEKIIKRFLALAEAGGPKKWLGLIQGGYLREPLWQNAALLLWM